MAMKDWYRSVAAALVGRTRARGPSEAETALEVALGQAREPIAYLLELSRAHRIGARGNLVGDDVWIQLGDRRLRLTLNRRDATLAMRPGSGEGVVVHWDADRKALADCAGVLVDVVAMTREVLATLVGDWSSDPSTKVKGGEGPPGEHEDEPTKA